MVTTRPLEQWAVSRELRHRLKRAFDDAGIVIPFPQRTLWLRQDDQGLRADGEQRVSCTSPPTR